MKPKSKELEKIYFTYTDTLYRKKLQDCAHLHYITLSCHHYIAIDTLHLLYCIRYSVSIVLCLLTLHFILHSLHQIHFIAFVTLYLLHCIRFIAFNILFSLHCILYIAFIPLHLYIHLINYIIYYTAFTTFHQLQWIHKKKSL